jgi:hypothetical protein
VEIRSSPLLFHDAVVPFIGGPPPLVGVEIPEIVCEGPIANGVAMSRSRSSIIGRGSDLPDAADLFRISLSLSLSLSLSRSLSLSLSLYSEEDGGCGAGDSSLFQWLGDGFEEERLIISVGCWLCPA